MVLPAQFLMPVGMRLRSASKIIPPTYFTLHGCRKVQIFDFLGFNLQPWERFRSHDFLAKPDVDDF